jgi:hypothetical protein
VGVVHSDGWRPGRHCAGVGGRKGVAWRLAKSGNLDCGPALSNIRPLQLGSSFLDLSISLVSPRAAVAATYPR